MTIRVRLLAVIPMFLALASVLLAFPISVSAQAACTVVINGVTASPSNTDAPTASAYSKSGSSSTYPVSVTLSDPALQRYEACGTGRQLMMPIWQSTLLGWNRVDLISSGGNSFTGTLVALSDISRDATLEIRVETKAGSANCPEFHSICQTRWIKLDGESLEGDDVSCTAHKTSLEASLDAIPSIVTNDQPITVPITTSPDNAKRDCGFHWIRYQLRHESGTQIEFTDLPTTGNITFSPDYSGNYTFTMQARERNCSGVACGAGAVVWSKSKSFCSSPDGTTCVPPVDDEVTDDVGEYQICNQLQGEALGKCEQCYGNKGIWTAVGCIQTDGTTMVKQILQIAMGIAGGIALIMILAAGFMLSVSQGDPKRVSEARELITSAIIGLLFIVFSVTILQFIGVTLFRIPGLGGG